MIINHIRLLRKDITDILTYVIENEDLKLDPIEWMQMCILHGVSYCLPFDLCCITAILSGTHNSHFLMPEGKVDRYIPQNMTYCLLFFVCSPILYSWFPHPRGLSHRMLSYVVFSIPTSYAAEYSHVNKVT